MRSQFKFNNFLEEKNELDGQINIQSNADVTGNLNQIRYTSASQTTIPAKFAAVYITNIK